MNEVVFSIIVPCYNVEKYISQTVESVLKQKFNNFELILINDGSIDKTKEIIEFYKNKDKRIRIINKNNEGVSKTRNLGIELAQGEYLYFLDGDDYIENNLLEKANLIFKNKNISMFSFGYDVKNTLSLKSYSNQEYDGKIFNSETFLKYFLKKEINQSICSFIIKKSYLKNITFNSNLIIGEDIDFQIRLLLENKFNIFYDFYSYFHYIKREGSATTTKIISIKKLNKLDFLNALRNKALDKNIDEFKKYHIISFFYMIKELGEKGYIKEDYPKIKNKFKESEYILKDLKLELNKKSILLNILKVCYKINFKFILFVFKINKIFNKK